MGKLSYERFTVSAVVEREPILDFHTIITSRRMPRGDLP